MSAGLSSKKIGSPAGKGGLKTAAMKKGRNILISLLLALAAFSASGVEAQKCSYDTKGPEVVPFVFASIRMGGGKVRILKGDVTDPNGAPIPGAALALFKLTPGETGGRTFTGSTRTGEDGRYCFGSLPVGRYILHIGTEGFQRTEVEFKMVSANSRAGKSRVDVTLGLGL
jgi:hypothetical protein